MAGIATLTALVLAAVFATAAVAKLRRPDATAADFADLGLPAAGLLARLVPLTELGTAAALLVVPGWGAVVAAGLLTLFTALLVGVVRGGRVVRCACFGSSGGEPVSGVEIVRNVILLAASSVVVPLDRLGGLDLPSFVAVSVAGLGAVVVVHLAALRRDAGPLWRVEPSLETPPLENAVVAS